MADKSVEIKSKVDACLKKVEKMRENNEEDEAILSYISETLEELCPKDSPIVLEVAPLNYTLGRILIDVINGRAEDEDNIDNLDLNEDDCSVAWQNLQTAKASYLNSNDVDKYKAELADIDLALGEVDLFRGDYDSAVTDFTECLKYRQAYCSENSRDVADVLYNLGISLFTLGQSNVLASEDDESLVEVAKKNVADAFETFVKTQKVLCHCCLDLALKEKLIEKKEEDIVKQVKSLKNGKKTEEIDGLISIIEDIDVNIENAKSFDVKSFLEQDKKDRESYRNLVDGLVDEEDDEDFEEEEEEEDDDIVIDDIEEMKKSVKRVNEEEDEEEGSKRAKTM